MADTPVTLSNIVQHDKEFLATIYQAMTLKSKLRAAGIIVDNPLFAERANGAGKVTSVPFWNPLAQTESKVPTDASTNGEVEGITQGEMLALINKRGNGWSSNDVVADLLKDDPMTAIANRIAEYWTADENKMAMSIFAGILADDAAAAANMAVGDGTGVLTPNLVAQAAETCGDSYQALDTLIVHKKVHTLLQIAEGNNFVPASKTDFGFDTYLGYRLIIDSSLPVASGVYTSVLTGSGFFQAGEGAAKVPLAVERSERASNFGGQETLVSRRQFLLHPMGMNQNGSSAGIAPTNAELAAATMWAKAYNRENIACAFIKSDLTA